jgi:carbonic anhydrase
MDKLIQGVHLFQNNIFGSRRALFERLVDGQKPLALFITCSDSRVNPNLITQAEPGELFIMRNAGNLIPPFGASNGGEAATVEFAVAGLHVRDVIVCGHSLCGAMDALLNPKKCAGMPEVSKWLGHAEATRRIIVENYEPEDNSPSHLLNVTIQENVLTQLENLRTHPAVAAALSRGELRLHGWIYKFETGDVFAYSHEDGQFLPLTEHRDIAPVATRALVGVNTI